MPVMPEHRAVADGVDESPNSLPRSAAPPASSHAAHS
jgi:hypothetical protein